MIFLFVILSIFLSGCKENENISDNTNINSELDIDDLTIKDECDAEAWMDATKSICNTNNGAYIVKGTDTGEYLFYYDYNENKYTKVCSNPECLHNDQSCTAFLPTDLNDKYYDPSCIQLYENNILIGGIDNKKACIYKINGDGSGREKYIDLFDAEISVKKDGDSTFQEYNSFTFYAHREYIYYIIENGATTSLFRKRIDKKSKPEELVSGENEKSTIYRIEPYGRYVFFQKGQYSDDYRDIDSVLCAYDTETERIIEVKEDILNAYMIREKCLYYEVAGEGVYEYAFDTKEDKLVVNNQEICYQIWKTKYGFVTQGTNGLSVYDNSGNLLKNIEYSKCNELCYVNDSIMVTKAINVDGVAEYSIYHTTEDIVSDWKCNTIIFE